MSGIAYEEVTMSTAPVWTWERKKLLRREWARHTPIELLLMKLRELPGRPGITPKSINKMVRFMGLERSSLPLDEDQSIAEYITQHGVTRCPPAAAAPTTACIPEEATQALRAHDAKLAKPSTNSWVKIA